MDRRWFLLTSTFLYTHTYYMHTPIVSQTQHTVTLLCSPPSDIYTHIHINARAHTHTHIPFLICVFMMIHIKYEAITFCPWLFLQLSAASKIVYIYIIIIFITLHLYYNKLYKNIFAVIKIVIAKLWCI